MLARLTPIFTFLAIITFAPALWARDVVLTIGGGYDSSGNQNSLEKNVQYFTRVLDSSLPAGVDHTIYFADGDQPARDLQYLAEPTAETRALELLSQVFGQEEHFFERYRTNLVPQVAGESSRENLKVWFRETARSLTEGDRLFIYVTAHGGESIDPRDPQNTRLHLWNHEDVTVRELTNELDHLSPDVPVVVVMVQCYSGGFSNLIYRGGDPSNGLAPHRRIGFFATTHDRVAAGCTPAINEADYEEYSSSFWAALTGQTRLGEKITPPDYDKDGKTSFAEAHAYVLLQGNTIDLPVKTTDTFLRTYSQAYPAPHLASAQPERLTALRPAKPLAMDAQSEDILAAADPLERTVINGLSAQLELDQSQRAIAAGQLAMDLEEDRERIRRQLNRLDRQIDNIRLGIEASLLGEWPELTNPWNPEARRLVAEESEKLVAFLERHSQFEKWQSLRDKKTELEDQDFERELLQAKCDRLLYVIETVVLANNLPLVADEKIINEYIALRKAENSIW